MKMKKNHSDKEDYLAELESIRKSKSFRKLWHLCEALSRTTQFQKELVELRSRLDIPLKGYRARDKDFNILELREFNEAKRRIYKIGVAKICTKHQLAPMYWSEIVGIQLFYNKIKQPVMGEYSANQNILLIDQKEENEQVYPSRKEDDEFFPIAIRLSPNTTISELRDFITRSRHHIERLQSTYRPATSLVGKTRARPTDLRNDYIFKKAHLPHKEIARLVIKKFGQHLDVGHISTILSREKKRRQHL